MIIRMTIDTEERTISAEPEDYGDDYWVEWSEVNFNTTTIATLIEGIKEDLETYHAEEGEEEEDE